MGTVEFEKFLQDKQFLGKINNLNLVKELFDSLKKDPKSSLVVLQTIADKFQVKIKATRKPEDILKAL